MGEADEETVELRLLSEPAFGEEFDITVDEIATLYLRGQLPAEEKKQVEEYFLRSPERRKRVQFICELLRQIDQKATPPPPVLNNNKPANVWQRVSSLWTGQPSAFRPALVLTGLLIVVGVICFVLFINSKPTYLSFVLSMTSAERSAGTEIRKVHLERGVAGLRIKLNLPTPRAPQYRVSLRGEKVSLPQLTIETQDAESLTVIVPADQITEGVYALELVEVNDDKEKPLRGEYVFAVV